MNRILLISYLPPSRGHAGGQRILDLYSELKCIEPSLHVSLLTCDVQSCNLEQLEEAFDEVLCIPEKQFTKYYVYKLNFKCTEFDVIDLQYHQSGALIGFVRKRWPGAKLIFAPMESQLRTFQIELKKKKSLLSRSWRSILGLALNALTEVLYVIRADQVVTVSDKDRQVIDFWRPTGGVACLPTCISQEVASIGGSLKVTKESSTVVFFAYFGSRTNQEALYWFVKEVHPAICKVLPNYRFRVVGHGLTEELLEVCAIDQVEIVGAVNTIFDAIEGAAVGISPALSGAGVRGKIHQYAELGLPTVASPIACEGLAYQHGESIFIADTAHEFAEACIGLLRDEKFRDAIGNKANEVCRNHYQWPSWRTEMVSIYELDN